MCSQQRKAFFRWEGPTNQEAANDRDALGGDGSLIQAPCTERLSGPRVVEPNNNCSFGFKVVTASECLRTCLNVFMFYCTDCRWKIPLLPPRVSVQYPSVVSQVLVDVNERDAEDVPLLHWAAINDRREIVKHLLKQVSSETTGEHLGCLDYMYICTGW